jgi:hypothetical protein
VVTPAPSAGPAIREAGLRKYLISGALIVGFGVSFIHHGLSGLWLLAWPLGALVGFAAWFVFNPGARAARHIETYRPHAAQIRRSDPELYMTILEQPGGREAAADGKAEEYVAAFLWATKEAGQKGSASPSSPVPNPRGPVGNV